MTTPNSGATKAQSKARIVFPDPPERPPEEMTSFDHLTMTGNAHYLALHFGNPDTTLVAGEHYMSPEPRRSIAGLKFPDLLVAFGVDPASYKASNAYVLSEQGKPPDFVLEIASPSTGREDTTVKRDAYAALGILEYWRFDETGQYHRARLAADRLADTRYEPMPIEELSQDVLQGYSPVLNLYIRWDHGRLEWHDPATGAHIATLDTEREARLRAEARVQELEEELRRLRQGPL